MELKERQERLVFVDPEDEDIPYWWPAIVVPEVEYELFKETMDNDAGVNVGEHERLVCYFEDGSFSVVPKSGLIPFHPQREPYKSYSTRLKHFLTDAGVKRATDFHNSGKIPKMFKWLILGETGYLDPEEIEEGEFEEEEEAEAESEEKVTDDVLSVNEVVEIEKKEREPQQQKQKVKKRKHTEHNGHSEHGVKIKKHQTSANSGNKRGRKPKHAPVVTIDATVTVPPSDHSTNDSLSIKSHEIIVSPKTINPLERMKIEALISSTTNNM